MRVPLTTLAAVTVGFWIYGIATDSPFVWYYVPITAVVTGVLFGLHRSFRFSIGVIWGLVMVGIGNLAGGVLMVGDEPLYQLVVLGDIRYDKPFHALATGVAGWASYELISAWGTRRRSHGQAFGAVLMACGAGSLVEIVEFIGSRIFESTSVGDYDNNMLDLVANLVGALVAVLVVHMASGRHDTAPDRMNV